LLAAIATALRRFLFGPQPAGRLAFLRWCVLAWPLAVVPALLLVAGQMQVVEFLGLDVSSLEGPEVDPSRWVGWVGPVLIAPVVETALLGLGINALCHSGLRPGLAVAVNALLWALLHGFFAWTWFIGPLWGFFVYGSGWQLWSSHGRWQAFLAAALPHALNNATVMLLVLVLPE
jgi:hypothetical protein